MFQAPHIVRIEDFDCEDVLVQALEGFLSAFEEASGDRVFQQLMIAAPPQPTGSAFVDGLIAALAEHLAIEYRLRVPSWVHDEWRAGPSAFTTTAGAVPDAAGVGRLPLAFYKRRIGGTWPRRLLSSITADNVGADHILGPGVSSSSNSISSLA